MSDFWSRKKAELEQTGQIPSKQRSEPISGAWWQEPVSDTRETSKEPQRPSEGRTELSGNPCPNCHSGNYHKPTPSTAARCFDCGYVDGRQLNEPNLSSIVSTGVPSVRTKQLASGGHFGSSVAEINHNNAVLERSAQGREKIS